ncbi:MAG: CoA transferase subunit A [Spirochaetaceae bacterium]|nr:MAG: CoA transferase subunit A [Spirochaetaceae bacterium]
MNGAATTINKETTLSDAVGRIEPGATVMVGGFMTVGTPENLVDELVRQGQARLRVVCNDAGTPGRGVGKLVRSGQIASFVTSHIGLNPEMGQAMTDGRVDVELVPQGTLAERIRSAGAGLGGFLTPTGVGTVVQEGKQVLSIDGRDYLLELPLRGHVALVRAQVADRMGNLRFYRSARNFNPLIAMACDYVIAQVDRIVDTGEIDPDSVMLPGILVDALVIATGEVNNG